MIDPRTLQKITEAQQCLVKCRRTMEDVRDHELKESEWQPGSGEKPHRVKALNEMILEVDDLVTNLDRLWS